MKILSARGKKDITQTRMHRLIVDFSVVVIENVIEWDQYKKKITTQKELYNQLNCHEINFKQININRFAKRSSKGYNLGKRNLNL